MKYYGQAQEITEGIVETFRSGDVATPLAQVFIKNSTSSPMFSWSILNQFICLLNGCLDARGYKQWQQVGRFVKKGERAKAAILVPLTKKYTVEEDGKEVVRYYVYGFKTTPVFDISQTDGDPLQETDTQVEDFINNLPLKGVAEAFGLDVSAYNGKAFGAQGLYSPTRQLIALGVENVSTWFHELLHAADDKLGNLKEAGQHWRSEIVAELGGATLAIALGLEVEADLGGCWEYIQHYANHAGIEPATACMRCIDRIGKAINLIMETAESLSE